MTTTSLMPAGTEKTAAVSAVHRVAFALTGIIAASALLQWIAVLPRTSVTYLPDEYLYSQMARSIGTGHGLNILGVGVAMPAVLESIAIAGFWRLSDAETALHLTQAFHSLVMSLGALPIYSMARQLKLSEKSGLACAAIAALAPGMLYVGYVTADPLGYLLALIAVDAALRACVRPTLGTQAWFLAATGLAAASRVQYLVLIPAFLVAGFAAERYRPLKAARRFAFVLGIIGLGALAALAVGADILGRYDTLTGSSVSEGTIVWLGKTSMFLLVTVGAALSPGALAWALTSLTGPRDRVRRAFAALMLALLAILVIASATVSAETGSDRFFERYLLIATPLVALAFMCWLDERRPGRAIVVVVAAIVIIGASRFPISGDLIGQGSADSPTFRGIGWFAEHIGLTNASLVIALVATACAVLALIAALTPRMPALVLGTATALVLVTVTVAAHAGDALASKRARDRVFVGSPTWVEAARPGKTLLIQTKDSNQYTAMVTIVSNPSIVRAEPLGPNEMSSLDGIGDDPIAVDGNGFLHESDGRVVTGSVLIATGSTASVFSGAERLAHERYFTLAIPKSGVPARLRALAYGIRADRTVAPEGTITAFAPTNGRCTKLTLELTVPRGVPGSVLEFRDPAGQASIRRVTPGKMTSIDVISHASSPETLRFQATKVGGLARPFGAPKPDSFALVYTVALGAIHAKQVSCPQRK